MLAAATGDGYKRRDLFFPSPAHSRSRRERGLASAAVARVRRGRTAGGDCFMPGDQRRPSTPGWRKAAPAAPRAARPDWRKRPQRRPADRARRLKIATGVAALVGVNVALLLAAFWLS